MNQKQVMVRGHWRKNPKTGKPVWVHRHTRKIEGRDDADFSRWRWKISQLSQPHKGSSIAFPGQGSIYLDNGITVKDFHTGRTMKVSLDEAAEIAADWAKNKNRRLKKEQPDTPVFDGYEQKNLTTKQMLRFATIQFWENERTSTGTSIAYSDFDRGQETFLRLFGNGAMDDQRPLQSDIEKIKNLSTPTGLSKDTKRGFEFKRESLLEDLEPLLNKPDPNRAYLMYMIKRNALNRDYLAKDLNVNLSEKSSAFWENLGKERINDAIRIFANGGTKVRLTDPGVTPRDVYKMILYNPLGNFKNSFNLHTYRNNTEFQKAFRRGLSNERKKWLAFFGHASRLGSYEINLNDSAYTAYDDWAENG